MTVKPSSFTTQMGRGSQWMKRIEQFDLLRRRALELLCTPGVPSERAAATAVCFKTFAVAASQALVFQQPPLGMDLTGQE